MMTIELSDGADLYPKAAGCLSSIQMLAPTIGLINQRTTNTNTNTAATTTSSNLVTLKVTSTTNTITTTTNTSTTTTTATGANGNSGNNNNSSINQTSSQSMLCQSTKVSPLVSSNNNNNKSALLVSPQPLLSTPHGQPQTPIKIRHDPISDNYELDLRPFARGKFAQVRRCIHKDTKKAYAAKCIKKRRRMADIKHEIMHEIHVLQMSRSIDRIVDLHEVYETPSEMILILEMADGGDLQRVLDDEEAIDEIHVRRIVRQILEGLIYLHNSQIAHLDIKPQNLLLTHKFPDADIKLCDFGLSRRVTQDVEIREICGTPDYVAPEILRYDPISLATDMWSLGVMTYVLLSGYSPFGSEDKQMTYCNITTASLDFPDECFEGVSREAIDFIQKLVIREPSKRLTCHEALQHKWLSNTTLLNSDLCQ